MHFAEPLVPQICKCSRRSAQKVGGERSTLGAILNGGKLQKANWVGAIYKEFGAMLICLLFRLVTQTTKSVSITETAMNHRPYTLVVTLLGVS